MSNFNCELDVINEDNSDFYSKHSNQSIVNLAHNCLGYSKMNNKFDINCNDNTFARCNNCKNFQHKVCQVGLYDTGLSILNNK